MNKGVYLHKGKEGKDADSLLRCGMTGRLLNKEGVRAATKIKPVRSRRPNRFNYPVMADLIRHPLINSK
jgi:hypothetical protein